MTVDAIMLNRDAPRAAGLQGVSSTFMFDMKQKEDIRSKKKAWLKWGVNLGGDTISVAWSSKTFKTPKEGVDYHARNSSTTASRLNNSDVVETH